ncbi:MAG: phosphatase PAP2 family protein [Candidatus Pacearchaeota archaeon]
MVNKKMVLVRDALPRWANNFFVFLGNYSRIFIILISVILFFILFLSKRRRDFFVLIITLITGLVIENFLKYLIPKERPQIILENGNSFPSGHAISSTILFSLLIYFYQDKIKNNFIRSLLFLMILSLVFIIGFSRIYINVHWFSDIIGGYFIGLSLTFLFLYFLDKKPLIF